MDSAPNWEVYHDALVPTQNKPPPRPWERAPVPAHAPRLQGRQIWKKAGIRLRENCDNDASQAELESEGAGARKRMRSAAGKENIGDALWANSGTITQAIADHFEGQGMGEDEREQPALQFVPRKRTNTDRVITPRKPLGQTTLNGRAQTLLPLKDEDGTVMKPERRRKSLRKSMVAVSESKSALSAIPETVERHDTSHKETQQSPNIETEREEKPQPYSENNSRQSIVAAAEPAPTPAHALPEVLRAASIEDKSHRQPTTEPPHIHEKSQGYSRRSSAKSMAMVSKQQPSLPSTQEATPVSTNEDQSNDDTQQPTAELVQPTSSRSSRRSAGIMVLQPALEGSAQELTETSRKIEEVDTDQAESHEITDKTANSNGVIHPPVVTSQVLEITVATKSKETTQAPYPCIPPRIHELVGVPLNNREDQTHAQSDEAHQIMLSSIEIEEPNLPLKVTGSPKKRKGTGSRCGTRRSLRTRASSAKAEEGPAPENAVSAEIQLILGAQNAPQSPREAPESSYNEAVAFEAAAGVQTPVDMVSKHEENYVDTVEEPFIPDPTEDIVPEAEIESFDLEDARQSIRPTRVTATEINLDLHEFDLDADVPVKSIKDPAPNSPQSELLPPVELVHILPEEMPFIQPDSPSADLPSDLSSPVQLSPASDREISPSMSDDQTVDILEVLEPIFVPADQTLSFKKAHSSGVDLPKISTPDLVGAISQHAPVVTYDDLDDTNMLRNFVTRVKADKAAKAAIPKRKRSLPHSPLQLPLGEIEPALSPSQGRDEFDATLIAPSPSKRQKRSNPLKEDEAATEPKSIRRSGRTRLPVVKNPVAAPSFIPVRRIGQDVDATVTIRRSEEKALAAVTKINTRKNRGAALAAELLIKRAEEKGDPALRQRLLKEVFDEKEKRNKRDPKGKSVKWKDDIAEFQSADGKSEIEKEEKVGAVRVGGKSKIAAAETPVAKRRTREKS